MDVQSAKKLLEWLDPIVGQDNAGFAVDLHEALTFTRREDGDDGWAGLATTFYATEVERLLQRLTELPEASTPPAQGTPR